MIDKGGKGKYLKHSGNDMSTYIVFLEEEAVYDAWGRLDISCITEITLQNDVYFDKKGYFNPTDIRWRGKLSKQRIADLLPLEYYGIVSSKTTRRHLHSTSSLIPHLLISLLILF